MNQKSLDKKKTSELFEGVGSSLHQSFVEAVERGKKKTKELDWTKTIQNSVNRQIDLITIFYSLKTPQDLEKLLTQQRTELLEEINKSLIGELVIVKTREPYCYQNKRSIPKEQYEFLLEQRQKLINLLNKKDE